MLRSLGTLPSPIEWEWGGSECDPEGLHLGKDIWRATPSKKDYSWKIINSQRDPRGTGEEEGGRTRGDSKQHGQ